MDNHIIISRQADKNFGAHWIIDNRYAVFKNDGCIYDTEKAKDIPQYVFELRDELLYNNK